MTPRFVPTAAPVASSVRHVALLRGLAGAGWLAAALLAAAPALAQGTASPDMPPAAPGTGATTPPDIVRPRAAGPGDATAGVIHPGPTGDSAMHVPPPAGRSFPTPVIRPQTMQGDGTPVVPK